MLKTSEVAELVNLSSDSIRKYRKKMPVGMAILKNTRQWLFDKKAIQWILTRERSKPGRKRKNEKNLQIRENSTAENLGISE